jgi:hypothetical protein
VRRSVGDPASPAYGSSGHDPLVPEADKHGGEKNPTATMPTAIRDMITGWTTDQNPRLVRTVTTPTNAPVRPMHAPTMRPRCLRVLAAWTLFSVTTNVKRHHSSPSDELVYRIAFGSSDDPECPNV